MVSAGDPDGFGGLFAKLAARLDAGPNLLDARPTVLSPKRKAPVRRRGSYVRAARHRAAIAGSKDEASALWLPDRPRGCSPQAGCAAPSSMAVLAGTPLLAR